MIVASGGRLPAESAHGALQLTFPLAALLPFLLLVAALLCCYRRSAALRANKGLYHLAHPDSPIDYIAEAENVEPCGSVPTYQ